MTAQEVLDAVRPEDLFGYLEGVDDPLAEVKSVFRALARQVHPDRIDDSDLGNRAFARLNELFVAADRTIRDGTYGSQLAMPVDDVTIRTRRGAYTVHGRIGSGDSCEFFNARDGEGDEHVIKIARSADDNDLLQNEAKVLKHVHGELDTELLAYVAPYRESFTYRAEHARGRTANVFSRVDGLHTLQEVASSRPYGLDPRDAAWMYRRLLLGLGAVHDAGYVHGAVLPPHVLIHTGLHGLVLVDFKYAVPEGEPLSAISAPYRGWYPPEVTAREPVTAATDIYLASACMVHLLGGDAVTLDFHPNSQAPRWLRAFLKGCTFQGIKRRPRDAWALLEEFTELIEERWGPRRFREFSM